MEKNTKNSPDLERFLAMREAAGNPVAPKSVEFLRAIDQYLDQAPDTVYERPTEEILLAVAQTFRQANG